jgi:hypothetical protein
MTGYSLFLALQMVFAPGPTPHTSPELGYTMTVPAGFLRLGDDPLHTRAVACFVTHSVSDSLPWTRLCVERRGGALPKSAREMTFTWKGLDLRGASFDSEWNGEQVTMFAVLVPLRKEPVWLVTMARRADRAYAQSTLVAALSTLQGETATLSRGDRAERAGSRFGMIGSIIMAVGAGMWIMQRRQQQRS